MPSEFDIIRRYFSSKEKRKDVVLGIGDDAAILTVPENHQLVQSMDTLVAGIHFPVETSPEDIAYKALAVNLSDMAAMGAEPAWFTLAITIPEADEDWLSAFSQSLSALARQYNVQLVGGDTTNGPLCLSITINGFVANGKALLRRNAKAGDKIYVSGTLGDAALALAAWQGQCLLSDETRAYLNQRLNRPTPRVELGLLLRGFANSCIDISDGLVADLGHIVEESQLGASIHCERIPRSREFILNITDDTLSMSLALAGGDDYELCFTIPQSKQTEFEKTVKKNNISVACIGDIESQSGVRCFNKGIQVDVPISGYQHFVD